MIDMILKFKNEGGLKAIYEPESADVTITMSSEKMRELYSELQAIFGNGFYYNNPNNPFVQIPIYTPPATLWPTWENTCDAGGSDEAK